MQAAVSVFWSLLLLCSLVSVSQRTLRSCEARRVHCSHSPDCLKTASNSSGNSSSWERLHAVVKDRLLVAPCDGGLQ